MHRFFAPDTPDGARRVMGEPRVSTDDASSATGERRTATDERRTAADERHTAADERRTATGERRTATGEQRTATDSPRAIPQTLRLPSDESRHASQVLRLTSGEPVECFDGRGNAYSGVLGYDAEGAFVTRLTPISNNESPLRVELYQGMPKSDKLELIVQKAVELGAAGVTPVLMRRSVARPDRKDAAKRTQRLEKIALEATKQSGRSRVMRVGELLTWNETLTALSRDMENGALVLMPYELSGSGSAGLMTLCARGERPTRISIVIGPEGGISPEEAESAVERGAKLITLGPRILRTETAGLAALAQCMAIFGDGGGERA